MCGNSYFMIKFNSLIMILLSVIFLSVSILNFWTKQHESMTFLFLIVFISFASGLEMVYFFGALRTSKIIDRKWNQQHIFYPFVLLYFCSAICCINFIKLLANKYKFSFWADIIQEDIYEQDNFMMLVLFICLIVLAVTTCISSKMHYENSFNSHHLFSNRHVLGKKHETMHINHEHLPVWQQSRQHLYQHENIHEKEMPHQFEEEKTSE